MNNTQKELISRLVNQIQGSYKQGYTLTITKDKIFLSLQKLNEINQALKLEESFPSIIQYEYKSFRLLNVYLIDDTKARELIKCT
jgi:hypothetical protein